MTAAQMATVVTAIANNPLAGDVIKGSGGLRKLRIGLEGRGKRGGGRIIYWFYNETCPAVLLWVFAKNEASDLTGAQLAILAKAAEELRGEFGRNR